MITEGGGVTLALQLPFGLLDRARCVDGEHELEVDRLVGKAREREREEREQQRTTEPSPQREKVSPKATV